MQRQTHSPLGTSEFPEQPEPTITDWAFDAIKVDRLTAKAWEACEQKRWKDALQLLNEAKNHLDGTILSQCGKYDQFPSLKLQTKHIRCDFCQVPHRGHFT